VIFGEWLSAQGAQLLSCSFANSTLDEHYSKVELGSSNVDLGNDEPD